MRRMLLSVGRGALAILLIVTALTVLGAPLMGWGFKALFLLALAGLAALVYVRIRPGLAVVGIVVLSLILIIGINWGGIFNAIDTVLQLVFNPDRIDPDLIVVCSESGPCRFVHSFVFSIILLLAIITGFAYTTLLERRLIAFLQNRVGPNRVGPGGFLQPLADAIKLITKEDIIPERASYVIWMLSPVLKAVPVLIVIAVIPLGPDILVPWFAPSLGDVWYQVPLGLTDPNVGVLWLLAIMSIGTYGVVLAGWSSNNKYAMLGGLRASAQMISYELSLGLSLAVPVMLAGSMSIGDIVEGQSAVPILSWYVFQNPLAAGIMLVALIAEVNRAPFDLPEAEQELTAGFMTEYSGMKFALFMMAEYLGMIAVSMIAVSMFFGGYHFLLVDKLPFLGPLVVIGKVIISLMVFIWIRATLPRIRYDRLMMLGWKVMLPLALVAVGWTAVSVVIGEVYRDSLAYAIISGIVFVVVVGGGVLLLRRAGEPEDEDELAVDPVVTGEQRGLGYAVLTVVGALIAVLFALVNVLAWVFDIGRKLGEPKETALEEAKPSKPASAK